MGGCESLVNGFADRDELSDRLAAAAAPGDVIVALGAGDINRVLTKVEQNILVRARGPHQPAGGTSER